MKLVIFANFFPYKRSEPFLKNEFEFSKKYCESIQLFTLYGKSNELEIEKIEKCLIHPPVFTTFMDRNSLILKGLFNLSPFEFHFKELFSVLFYPKKLYRLILSMFISRAVLASQAFKDLESTLLNSEKTVLYFYWGDNLCWIIPYLKKKFPNGNVKIIMRLHGSDLYEELRQNYAPLRKSIFDKCDLLFTISEHGKKYLIQKYPDYESKIKISRLGVSDNGLNPYKRENVYNIVSASNMVALKRIDLIFSVLKNTNLPIHWYHFGDGPLMDQIQELTKETNSNLQVDLKGYVKNEELLNFYKTQSVDLFINLSTTEGLPVSIMEALSLGIPVTAPNIGGISELIKDENGKLISPKLSMEEISKEVTLILKSEKITEQRLNARKTFETLVSAETNYSEFYKTILAL